ncbi:MAG: site-specific DNA-methyltransferase [Nanoarchaeota archaeon]|nr:site-specific DNA-methyltransferase [Nanoarchaeota archaeon]
MDGKTMPIIDKNIAKLKELFPDAFAEGKINFEILKQSLGVNIETDKERYSFNWHNKSEAKKIALKQGTGSLRPDKTISKNWDKTKNLYIEGDNLEVLRLLQSSYRGKIKIIYIDPPYNKDKDFIYNDKFSDTIEDYKERVGDSQKTNVDTSGRYHTNWLNMMYPRLRLARNLLEKNGAIFISIDDAEVANLNKLCNEIFGEDNFVGKLIIKSNPRGSQEEFGISNQHEYVLCYTKSDEGFLSIAGETRNIDDDGFNFITTDGKRARLLGLRKRGGAWRRSDRPNMFFPFYVDPDSLNVSLDKDSKHTIEVLPVRPEGEESRWTWGLESAKSRINELIAKKINRNGVDVYDIYRIDLLQAEDGEIKRTKFQSIVDAKTMNYQNARQYIKDLFGNSELFDFPKPPELIIQILKNIVGDDYIVLDFFSGSATTAHSVMQINSEDGGNREFIMVQLPELTYEIKNGKEVSKKESKIAYEMGFKTISEIGMERIRRAGEKIKKDELEKIESELANLESKLEDEDAKKQKKELVTKKERFENLDIGFKTFKLDTTNLSLWDEKTDDIQATLEENIDAIKEGRTEEDVLYEVLVKYGIDLTVPIEEEELEGKKLYLIAGGYLTVCLEDNLDLKFIEKLAERKPHRVVFRDNGFKDDTVKTNAEMTLKKHGVEDIKVL